MKNIKCLTEGTKLIIEVDLTQEFGRSRTGKSIIVASTEGNVKVGEFFLGLNIYKFPKRLEDL